MPETNDAQNVEQGGKNLGKKGLNAAGGFAKKRLKKRAKKKRKELGKNILDKIKKILKWFVAVTGWVGPMIIAAILAFVIIINSITALLAKYQFEELNSVRAVLTEEAEDILELFDCYINEKYLSGRSSSEKESNTDEERAKYKKIYNFVKANKYEYELVALWKLTAMTYLPYVEHYNMSDEEKKDYTYSYSDNQSEPNITKVYFKRFVHNYIETYSNLEDRDANIEYKVGFHSSIPVDEYNSNYLPAPYVTNQLFKCCLDAFVDKNGNYIVTYDELIKELKAEAKKNKTTFVEAREGIDDRSEELTARIFDNFVRGMKNRGYLYDSNDGSISMSIYQGVRVYAMLMEYDGAYVGKDGDTGGVDAADKNCFKKGSTIYDQLINTASGFITNGGIGGANELIRLAKQQLGNGGERYCREMGWGLVDWCCIYAGWLLKHGADIEISDYGWSAAVPTWIDQLKAKHPSWYKPSGSGYTPKAGDIVFFGRYHVGIVIEVKGDSIVTTEGNTSAKAGSGEYCTRSIVDEHTYYLSNSELSYGVVTYYSEGQDYDENGNYVVGNARGAYIKGTSYTADTKYKGKVVKLSKSQRAEIEKVVSGEFGTSYEGSLLIAQCIRDAITYGHCTKDNFRTKMGYTGYNENVTSNAKKAVSYIFDSGGMAIQHRIFVMYATDMMYSSWHESQHFIIKWQNVKFFDYWN